MVNKPNWIITVIIILLAAVLAFIGYRFLMPQTIELEEPEIPLGITVTLDPSSQEVIARIQAMETALQEKLGTSDQTVINHGVLAFLRQTRYGYKSSSMNRYVWDQFGGTLAKECGIDMGQESVKQVYEPIAKLGTNLSTFNDPLSGQSIDFEHMAAVIDLYYTKSEDSALEEAYYDALFSWGGDLETYLIDLDKQAISSGDKSYDSLYTFARNNLGQAEGSHFGASDYLADLDGLNVATVLVQEDMLLSEALLTYYEGGLVLTRNRLFIESFGGEEAFIMRVKAVACLTPENQYADSQAYQDFLREFANVKQLMLQVVSGKRLTVNEPMRQVLSDSFVNLVTDK